MNSVNELHGQAPRRFAVGVAADPQIGPFAEEAVGLSCQMDVREGSRHEPLEILRMNIARYRAMLASPEDGEHRRQIERVLLDYEAALLCLEAKRYTNR